MSLNDINLPGWALLAVGGGLVLVLALLLTATRSLLRRRRNPTEQKADQPAGSNWLLDSLTLAVAVIATATSAQGMWTFFGEAFHANGLLRVALFAMFEAALVVFALNARANIRREPGAGAGFDGLAVWIMAVVTGILAATEADSAPAILGRLLVPLVAAMLWERDLIRRMRERASAARKARQNGGDTEEEERLRWRFSPRELAVRWGWAHTNDLKLSDVARQRQLRRLGQAAWRVYRLNEAKASKPSRALAARRLDRRLHVAAGDLELSADDSVNAFTTHLGWLRDLRTSLVDGQLPAAPATQTLTRDLETTSRDLQTARTELDTARRDLAEHVEAARTRDAELQQLRAALDDEAGQRAAAAAAGQTGAEQLHAELDRLRADLEQARGAATHAAQLRAELEQTRAELEQVRQVRQPEPEKPRPSKEEGVAELVTQLRAGRPLNKEEFAARYGTTVRTVGRWMEEALKVVAMDGDAGHDRRSLSVVASR